MEKFGKSVARNVTLYPAYSAAFHFYAWMPIFFLYFNNHFSVAMVLRLEALYYAAAVLLEVPSGYFSDRVGRRLTLLISATSLAASYALFVLGSGFPAFATAQVFLAIGISFNSGTDISFHYDSLVALDRQQEFPAREARIARNALLTSSVASLLGGMAGLISLRLAYLLSLLGALVCVAIVFLFTEPPPDPDPPAPTSFVRQLLHCFKLLRDPLLAWLLAYSIVMMILNHVPYELFQPYLDLLGAQNFLPARSTPLSAGLIMALSMFLGSWVASHSIRLTQRFGIQVPLLAAMLLQTLVVASMGFFLHPLVVASIMLRNVPMALARAPLNAAIAPRVGREMRATLLSLQSLAGRLAFSGALAALSLFLAHGQKPTWPTLSAMNLASAAAGLLFFVVMAFSFKLTQKA